MSVRGLAIGVVGIALVGFALYSYHSNAVTSARQAGEMAGRADALQQASAAPKFSHHADTLLSGPLTLAAGEIKRIPVVVKDDMSKVRIVGRFAASGGTRDDIEVLVFASRDDFTNWQSGNEARVIFQTGRKKVGDIDVSLKNAGTYDLVFSNKHAVLLLRNIDATVKLEYDTRER